MYLYWRSALHAGGYTWRLSSEQVGESTEPEPITSAEPALFGVYAVDLLSRWRALRGFRKTLEDDHD